MYVWYFLVEWSVVDNLCAQFLIGLSMGYSVYIGYSVIVALTGLPIGYSVIVALTGLLIGEIFSATIRAEC